MFKRLRLISQALQKGPGLGARNKQPIPRRWPLDSVWRPLSHNSTPDRQDNYGSDDSADQTRAFPGAIPSKGLAQPRSNERTDNSKNRCQDESRGFIAARRNQFRDHACDEADDDGPKYSHGALLFKVRVTMAH